MLCVHNMTKELFFLLGLILYVPSTIFQLCRDGSSSKLGLLCLAQGHNAVTLVRLKPAVPWSQVKHSTTEPLRSLKETVSQHIIYLGTSQSSGAII